MKGRTFARSVILAVLLQMLVPAAAPSAFAASYLQYQYATAISSDDVGQVTDQMWMPEVQGFHPAFTWEPAAPTDAQRDAMIALYQNTNGPNWTNQTGWLVDPSMCHWYGVTQCIDYGSSQRILALSLSNNNLTGRLPAQIGDLVDLKLLSLGWNHISGPIPDSMGNLVNMEQLWLERNELSGPIPGSLANLKQLEELQLWDNQLTGPVPEWLSRLPVLTDLELGENALSGPVPEFLTHMTQLRSLDLGWNELSGPIPSGLGALTNLGTLTLDENRLTGEIPSDIWGLSKLYTLALGGNGEITGTIPAKIQNLKSLGWLVLGRTKLRGKIPDELGQLTNLTFLDLSESQFSGGLPAGIGNLTKLRNLYLAGNQQLAGALPAGLTAATNMYQFTYNATQLCMPNNDGFRSWLQAVKGRGGVETSWKICGIEPHLSFSTPNALDSDVVLMHARLVDEESGRIRGSNQVSATVTGVEGSLTLVDDGTGGDLLALDGHYSRWVTVGGADTIEAILHYKGWPVISTTLALIADPQLIALTDLRRLNSEFTAWGTTPGEDLDGNNAADFYDMLDRVWRYAEKYRGIVYDLGHTITKERGYGDDYDTLAAGLEGAESRMGWLIRDLMARLYSFTGESIKYLVIVGTRPVAPTCTLDMGGNGSKTDIRRSDVPYAMRSYSTPLQEQRPAPDVAYSRISSERPSSLATLFDVYEQPLVTDPQSNAVTLYREDDYAFQIWDDDWKPWITPRFASGDLAAAPLYAAGHYFFYDGAVVTWRDVDVLQGLSGAAWTVINSHAGTTYNNTEESTRMGRGVGLPSPKLEGTDYGSIAFQPGHLYINAGCYAGFPPHATPEMVYVSQAVLDRYITYIGNTWCGREEDDPLWVAFADQLTLDSTPTVGAALVGAYGPYWARYDASNREATEQAYVKAFYGLPTQPLQHAAGGSLASVVAAASFPAVPRASQDSVATQRELTLSMDVPQFAYAYSAAGAIVRPANGGSVLAEEGQPILPLVATRIDLPTGATAVTVTELIAERLTENAGRVDLEVAHALLRGAVEKPVGSMSIGAPARIAAAGDNPGTSNTWACSLPCHNPSEPTAATRDGATAYPAASFRANVVPRDDGWVLYLSAIPASYATDHQLTLFHHMSFRIRYDVVAPPVAVSISGVTVNGGRPLLTGQANVPLKIGITTGQAASLTVAYEVVDPGGFTLADQQASAAFSAGTRQVAMTLDTRGWSPGPKVLNVTVTGSGGLYDARAISVTPQGLRLALQAAPRRLPGTAWPLTATVRNETGAPVTGLEARFFLRLDGTPVTVSFVEGAPGTYQAIVPPAALPEGTHRAIVTVSDSAGHVASDEDMVAIGVYGRTYLPMILGRR